jgi:osmotically-inducible protein OsmY
MLLAGCSPITYATGAVATVGIAARQERGISGAVSDTEILAAVNAGLLERGQGLFTHVDVQVYEGRVLLSGPVATPEAKAAAMDVVRNVGGVREAIDEIEVDLAGFSDYVLDTWISQEMRGRLMFDADIRAINYSVHVANKTIYLLGVAQSEDELQRVLAHARDIAYVRRVANHVLLKDDPRRAL